MRSDLPSLNAGKAMAQAAHAANRMVWKNGRKKPVMEWLNQADGFGTTITLAASKKDISRIIPLAIRSNGIAGFVYDPTYPYITDSEIVRFIDHRVFSTLPPVYKDNGRVICFRCERTCGYLLVEDGSADQKTLVGDLPLYQ